MAASEKKGERYQQSHPAVHSLQSGLASKNRDEWAESAHLAENKGVNSLQFRLYGGEGGIRTPGTLSGTPVFKTGAINHSATSPNPLIQTA